MEAILHNSYRSHRIFTTIFMLLQISNLHPKYTMHLNAYFVYYTLYCVIDKWELPRILNVVGG